MQLPPVAGASAEDGSQSDTPGVRQRSCVVLEQQFSLSPEVFKAALFGTQLLYPPKSALI